MLPTALEHPHGLEASERTVERPVRRQRSVVVFVSETLGDLVAMELAAFATKRRRAPADCLFQREQLAGFPLHEAFISRYMLIVKLPVTHRQHAPRQSSAVAQSPTVE